LAVDSVVDMDIDAGLDLLLHHIGHGTAKAFLIGG
jgi:hypothetical protein